VRRSALDGDPSDREEAADADDAPRLSFLTSRPGLDETALLTRIKMLPKLH
jgi:hypothetical protein